MNKVSQLDSRQSGVAWLCTHLAGNVLAASLLVVHDTGRGGKDDVAERTGGEEERDPVLDLSELDVETGRDDSALVDASVELDDDLARAVVVDLLELVDVAVLLHHRKEADDDLARRAHEHLALATLLSVDLNKRVDKVRQR